MLGKPCRDEKFLESSTAEVDGSRGYFFHVCANWISLVLIEIIKNNLPKVSI